MRNNNSRHLQSVNGNLVSNGLRVKLNPQKDHKAAKSGVRPLSNLFQGGKAVRIYVRGELDVQHRR